MAEKVKVPGGAFYAGDGLTVDPVTRTVSAGGGSSVSTPDWNQNDPNASDYIKNRPGAYETNTLSEIYNGTVVNGRIYSNEAVGNMLDGVGNQCNVVLDGVEYDNLIVANEGGEGYVGDPNLTAYPFCLKHTFDIETFSAGFIFTSTGSGSQTLVVKAATATVVPLDSKYLPNGNIVNGPYDGTFTNDASNTFEIASTIDAGAIGANNVVKSAASLTVGYSNTNTGATLMAGSGLIASADIMVGNYNQGGVGEYAFVVGNGNGDTARHNALMIDKNGRIIVPSSTAGSTKYFAITVDDTAAITATETTL